MTADDARRTPRFAQIATFLRRPALADGDRADAVVLGVPYDGGSSFRPGARFGPCAVREASRLVTGPDEETLRVRDGGDVDVAPYLAEAMEPAVEDGVTSVLTRGAVPVVVGGDHSVSLPLLRAVAKAHGPVGLVHFDAHPDTSAPRHDGARHHGTPFRRALEEGIVDAARMVQVGIRDRMTDAEPVRWARERGVTVITAGDVAEHGLRATAQHVRSVTGAAPLHVSFDIDCVDPAYAPGTGTPAPGGLSSREALALVAALAGSTVTSADVVEVCPSHDSDGITAILAATVLGELLRAIEPRNRADEPGRGR
jgi:agmatinase